MLHIENCADYVQFERNSNTLENSDFLNFRRTGKTKFSGVPETLSVSQDAQKPSQNSLSVFDIANCLFIVT